MRYNHRVSPSPLSVAMQIIRAHKASSYFLCARKYLAEQMLASLAQLSRAPIVAVICLLAHQQSERAGPARRTGLNAIRGKYRSPPCAQHLCYRSLHYFYPSLLRQSLKLLSACRSDTSTLLTKMKSLRSIPLELASHARPRPRGLTGLPRLRPSPPGQFQSQSCGGRILLAQKGYRPEKGIHWEHIFYD